MDEFLKEMGELFMLFIGMPMQLRRESPVFFYALTAVLAICIAVIVVAKIRKRRRSKVHGTGMPGKVTRNVRPGRPCQHVECRRQMTTRVNSEGHPGCVFNEPCCDGCHTRHLTEALKRRANSEPKRRCLENPNHGNMQKEIRAGYIIDRCTSCNGVWMSGRG